MLFLGEKFYGGVCMEREMTIPSSAPATVEEPKTEEQAAPVEEKKPEITKEEAEYIEKVFFEEDEEVRLRDGRTYRIPPLSIRDARKLMKKLNIIDSAIIIANLIPEDEEAEDDRYDDLMEILHMAFKPYYKDVTVDYLADHVDLVIAKKIIDIMIGLNGLKKSL
jgi:hypothetical protein